jgi:serine/threonine protein kinase
MKVISQQEIYLQVEGGGDDNFEFSHTSFLLQDGSNFYKTRNFKRMTRNLDKIDLSELEIEQVPIPVEHYRPLVYDKLIIAPAPIPEGYHQKSPSLISYSSSNPALLSRILLQEAQICDLLASRPHPNVATYHGCIVEDGRIAGLCFTKYPQTPVNRMYHDNRSFDVQCCLQQIEEGIRHLHGLGLVHNDINPSNVMLDKNDHAVIIDLDSCCQEGKVDAMCGTYMWTDDGYDDNCAKRENDFCGLRKIRDWIEDPEPFHWNSWKDKEKHQQQGHHGQLDREGRECYLCK